MNPSMLLVLLETRTDRQGLNLLHQIAGGRTNRETLAEVGGADSTNAVLSAGL